MRHLQVVFHTCKARQKGYAEPGDRPGQTVRVAAADRDFSSHLYQARFIEICIISSWYVTESKNVQQSSVEILA